MEKNNKNNQRGQVRGNSAPLKIKNAGTVESTELIENKYYSNIAYRVKWIKWLSRVFLVLFFFAGIIFYPREVNVENFGYLLRYINIQGSGKSVKSEFQIELDEASSICYYKNNIAVLRKNRLDIYDMNGRKNYTSKLVYSIPVLRTSDKYLIAYDLGTNKMGIFNSFSKLYEYKGDRPVYFAEITNKGNIVYVTSEKKYQSAVNIMNNGFNIVYRCLYDKDWVMSADIDDKAETLAVAGYCVKDGDYLSKVSLYDTRFEEVKSQIEIIGEIPYSVKLNQSGIFAVFENSIRFYDLKGDEITKYHFSYRKIQKIALAPKAAAVVLNEKTLGTDDRILIFDVNGNILYDDVVNSEVMDINFSDDYQFLYYITRTGLYKITVAQGASELVPGAYDETADDIIYANEKNIYLSGLLKINILNID